MSFSEMSPKVDGSAGPKNSTWRHIFAHPWSFVAGIGIGMSTVCRAAKQTSPGGSGGGRWDAAYWEVDKETSKRQLGAYFCMSLKRGRKKRMPTRLHRRPNGPTRASRRAGGYLPALLPTYTI